MGLLCPLRKQIPERNHIILVSADAHVIDIASGKRVVEMIHLLVPPLAVSLAHSAAARIDPLQMARLSILHAHQPHIRQLRNASVVHLNGHDIVLAVGDCQCLAEVALVNEVAEHKACAAALDYLRQIFHRLADIRPLALGLEIQQFTYDVEDVLAAFLGRDKLLDMIREEDDPDLVVVLNGAEGQRGGNLSDHVPFSLHGAAEIQTTTDVHQKHHRQLAFLLENLDIRFVEAGRDIPFNVAYVVAVLVLSHLAEGHATPFERRVVLSRKDIAGEPSGFDFYLPDTLKNLRCFH